MLLLDCRSGASRNKSRQQSVISSVIRSPLEKSTKDSKTSDKIEPISSKSQQPLPESKSVSGEPKQGSIALSVTAEKSQLSKETDAERGDVVSELRRLPTSQVARSSFAERKVSILEEDHFEPDYDETGTSDVENTQSSAAPYVSDVGEVKKKKKKKEKSHHRSHRHSHSGTEDSGSKSHRHKKHKKEKKHKSSKKDSGKEETSKA